MVIKSEIIAIDVGTCGLVDARGHRIVEIAAIHLWEAAVTAEFQNLVDCSRMNSNSARRIKGITNVMLRRQPDSGSVFKDFRTFSYLFWSAIVLTI